MTTSDEITSEPTDEVIVLPFASEEVREAAKEKFKRTQHINNVLLKEVESHGAQLNYFEALVEGYFQAMVEIGLMEEDSWTAMQILWAERFHTTLTKALATVNEAVAKAEARAALTGGGVLQPKKSGLIVPPGVVRP